LSEDNMGARRHLWLIVILLAFALAACSGGSGSSGFDAFPSENAAIRQAVDEQRCIEHEGLTICAAGPSITPAEGVRIDTGLGDATSVTCVQEAADAPCSFTLPFAPQGFPPDAVFRVAVREDARGRWTIGPDLVLGGMPSLDAPVSVEATPRAPTAAIPIQIAVLVFIEPPGVLPGEVDALADSGADFAFVTPEFSLQPYTARRVSLPALAVIAEALSSTGR
jgi:hypothetical protein